MLDFRNTQCVTTRIFIVTVTDTSIQEDVGHADIGGGGDSIVDSHAGAVRSPPQPQGAGALSPVLSPTSPTSDTEHTTGTNMTNKFFSFRAVHSWSQSYKTFFLINVFTYFDELQGHFIINEFFLYVKNAQA